MKNVGIVRSVPRESKKPAVYVRVMTTALALTFGLFVHATSASEPAKEADSVMPISWNVITDYASTLGCFFESRTARQIRKTMGPITALAFRAHCGHQRRLGGCADGARGEICRNVEDVTYGFQKCVFMEGLQSGSHDSASLTEVGQICVDSALPATGEFPASPLPLEQMKSRCSRLFSETDSNRKACADYVGKYGERPPVTPPASPVPNSASPLPSPDLSAPK